jgi:hypothetical protein
MLGVYSIVPDICRIVNHWCGLKEPGYNDGEWTSMYLASQIFRYVVTQDKEVRAQAWKHFEAMELLNFVTGISNYLARTFKQRSDFPCDIPWVPSPVYSTLQFEGDTSYDIINTMSISLIRR